MKKPYQNIQVDLQVASEIELFLINYKNYSIEESVRITTWIVDLFNKRDFLLLSESFRRIYERRNKNEIYAMEILMNEISGKLSSSDENKKTLTLTFIGVIGTTFMGDVNQLDNLTVLEDNLARYLDVDPKAIAASPKCLDPYFMFEYGYSIDRYIEVDLARNFKIEACKNEIDLEFQEEFLSDLDDENEDEDNADTLNTSELKSQILSNFDDYYENPVAFDVSFDMEMLAHYEIFNQEQLIDKINAFTLDDNFSVFNTESSADNIKTNASIKIFKVGGVATVFNDNEYFLELIDFISALESSAESVNGMHNLTVKIIDSQAPGHDSIQLEFLNKKDNTIVESYETRELLNRSLLINRIQQHLMMVNELSAKPKVLH